MLYVFAFVPFLILSMLQARAAFTTTLANSKDGGQQVMRFSTAGRP